MTYKDWLIKHEKEDWFIAYLENTINCENAGRYSYPFNFVWAKTKEGTYFWSELNRILRSTRFSSSISVADAKLIILDMYSKQYPELFL